MPLTRTNKGAWVSNAHGTGAYTIPSFTPEANSLLVVFVMVAENAGSTDPSGDITISDSQGLTWQRQTYVGNATPWSYGQAAFFAQVASGVPMTVTVDCGARNIYTYRVFVVNYTGHDTAGPIGTTGGSGAMATDGAASFALNSAPSATSDVLALLGRDTANSTTLAVEGVGWTELADVVDSATGAHLQARTGSTSATVSWQDVSTVGVNNKTLGIAIEIKAAGAGNDALTLNGLTSTPSVGSLAFTQAHAITPSGLLVTTDTDSPALTQAHALALLGLTVAAQIPAPAITQDSELVPDGLTVASSVVDAVLAQDYAFTPSGLLMATETSSLMLEQVHALTLEGLLVAPYQHTLSVSEGAYMLEPISLLVATSIQAAALNQEHALTPAGLLVLLSVGVLVIVGAEVIYEVIHLTARLLRTVDLEATITKEIELTSELI